jgi:hypothetical protein
MVGNLRAARLSRLAEPIQKAKKWLISGFGRSRPATIRASARFGWLSSGAVLRMWVPKLDRHPTQQLSIVNFLFVDTGVWAYDWTRRMERCSLRTDAIDPSSNRSSLFWRIARVRLRFGETSRILDYTISKTARVTS